MFLCGRKAHDVAFITVQHQRKFGHKLKARTTGEDMEES